MKDLWKLLTGVMASALLTGLAAWLSFGGGVTRAEGQELHGEISEHDRKIAVIEANLATQQATLNEVKKDVKDGNTATQGKLDAILLSLPRASGTSSSGR